MELRIIRGGNEPEDDLAAIINAAKAYPSNPMIQASAYSALALQLQELAMVLAGMAEMAEAGRDHVRITRQLLPDASEKAADLAGHLGALNMRYQELPPPSA